MFHFCFEFYFSCTMFGSASGRKRSPVVHDFFVKNGESFECIVIGADQNPCSFKSKTSNGPSNLKEHLRKRHPKSFEEFKDAEREQTAKAKAEEEASKVRRLGGKNSSITDYVVKKAKEPVSIEGPSCQYNQQHYRQRHFSKLLSTFVDVSPRSSAHMLQIKNTVFRKFCRMLVIVNLEFPITKQSIISSQSRQALSNLTSNSNKNCLKHN